MSVFSLASPPPAAGESDRGAGVVQTTAAAGTPDGLRYPTAEVLGDQGAVSNSSTTAGRYKHRSVLMLT